MDQLDLFLFDLYTFGSIGEAATRIAQDLGTFYYRFQVQKDVSVRHSSIPLSTVTGCQNYWEAAPKNG